MDERTCATCAGPIRHHGSSKYCTRRCELDALNIRRTDRNREGLKHCRRCRRWQPRDEYDYNAVTCQECIDLEVAGRKYCPPCGRVKTLDNFGMYSGKGKPVPATRCKACQSAKDKEYNSRPEVAARLRSYHYEQRYGMTAEEYDRRVESQQGRCAICDEVPTARPLNVDHDHACCPDKYTGCGRCVRGLICSPCNTALAQIRDNPNVADALGRYLRSHNARKSENALE